ncbi:MAG: urease accessory protein UreD [Succinivibrionaceae bacterium]
MLESEWCARLDLEFKKIRERNVMTNCSHYGPLVVQKVFYPELTSHVYILHPPGGIAGGDNLAINVSLDDSAQVLLTTPGSAKFYRTESKKNSCLNQTFEIGDNAELEIMPAPNIFFKGTNTKLSTKIYLHGNGKFFYRDISVLGNPLKEIDFSDSFFRNSLFVYRDDNLILHEVTRVNGNYDLFSKAILDGNTCIGTVIFNGGNSNLVEDLGMKIADYTKAITLIDDLVIIRILAKNNEIVEQAFFKVWLIVRKYIMFKDPVIPRIWST